MSDVVWREALTQPEREEVYTFRYEHYFAGRGSLPGVDHTRHRVWLPQDEASRHFITRDADGAPAAVGSATPLSAPELDAEYAELFDVRRLAPVAAETVAISRLVVAENARNTSVFREFCIHAARTFMALGFRYAVHYCSPVLVPLYERLGYRMYSTGMNLGGGAFRLPMILASYDRAYFERIGSPFRVLGGGSARAAGSDAMPDDGTAGGLHAGGAVTEPDTFGAEGGPEGTFGCPRLLAACPEAARLPLCALAPAEKKDVLVSLMDGVALPEGIRLRGSLIPIASGCVLAGEGCFEGRFLVLQGMLRSNGLEYGPGAMIETGGAAVTAGTDTLLLTL